MDFKVFTKGINTYILQKNDPLKKSIKWRGLKIGIEWPKGSTREYANSDFKKYMYCSYGYIKDTTSRDREEVDVYVNEDNLDSDKIFKVVQMRDPAEGKGTWDQIDEMKYMIGFNSQKEAGDMYKKCMTKKHFGSISEVPIEEFLTMIKNNIKRKRGK